MREIKFRAWNGEMHTEGVCVGEGWVGVVWIGGGGGYDFDGDAIIMQYTGLKDKNGTEIYEGDIINDQFNCGQLHSIEWNGKTSGFDKRPINSCLPNDNPSAISICPDTTTKGIVIGNIHENPELLGDK